jgi:hypothetical protein
MTSDEIFERLSSAWRGAGPAGVLDELAGYLLDGGRYHELFEARKMQLRQQLGLPLWAADGDETLSGEIRQRLEEGLVEACREVGVLLLRAGRLRDGWHYLRAVGDRELVYRELVAQEPSQENLDEYLELCIHEGFDLHRGFELMIRHYGTCNSITTFDSAMYGRPRRQRAIGAGLLVQHLHDELRANVLSHVERQEGQTPRDTTLPGLMHERPWLFAQGTYHVDTTHLASVVRFARDLDDPELVRRSLELALYGQQLDTSLQYPGDEPFEQLYPASCRYFRALLGEERDEQIAFFRQRAEASDPREETTLAIETYIDLLARVGQHARALDEALRLLPEGIQQTGRAPSLWELAEAAGNFAPLQALARQRGDALGFAVSLLKAGPSSAE